MVLADHLLRERSIRGLHQKEAAKIAGVSEATFMYWETGQTKPCISSWLGIIHFLGYDPNPAPTTLGERMAAKRRQMGWPMKVAAKAAGLDEGTWREVESGDEPKSLRIGARLERAIGSSATDAAPQQFVNSQTAVSR